MTSPVDNFKKQLIIMWVHENWNSGSNVSKKNKNSKKCPKYLLKSSQTIGTCVERLGHFEARYWRVDAYLRKMWEIYIIFLPSLPKYDLNSKIVGKGHPIPLTVRNPQSKTKWLYNKQNDAVFYLKNADFRLFNRKDIDTRVYHP